MRLILLSAFFVIFAHPVYAAEAIFAGGCFWCMEKPFESLKGVSAVESGYAGGYVENPTYKQVSKGETGHIEVVRVTYDPKKVSYKKLLKVFWRNIDPFDAEGQFCDKGDQYRSAIFINDDKERQLAEESKADLEKRFGETIATEILHTAPFYRAEEYHQDFYIKNAWKYKFYRGGCGRDKRLKEVWGKEAGGY